MAAKARVARLQRYWGIINKRAIFNALKTKYQKERRFINFISGAAKKYDTIGLKEAYNAIRRYRHARDACDVRDKAQATREMVRVLKQLYRRKMTQNLSVLRNNAYNTKKKITHQLNMLMHMSTRTIRDAFYKWKEQAQKAETVEEVNLIGPVVEEVLEHRLDVKNL